MRLCECFSVADLHSKNLDALSLSVQFSSFSSSFEELAKCSQNMSCGQCEVSKHLANRHIVLAKFLFWVGGYSWVVKIQVPSSVQIFIFGW